jgi:signal transduction histidine kinase
VPLLAMADEQRPLVAALGVAAAPARSRWRWTDGWVPGAGLLAHLVTALRAACERPPTAGTAVAVGAHATAAALAIGAVTRAVPLEHGVPLLVAATLAAAAVGWAVDGRVYALPLLPALPLAMLAADASPAHHGATAAATAALVMMGADGRGPLLVLLLLLALCTAAATAAARHAAALRGGRPCAGVHADADWVSVDVGGTLGLWLDAQVYQAEAEAARRAQRLYVAHLAHAVRSPLQAITAASSFLSANELPREHADLVRAVATSGSALKVAASWLSAHVHVCVCMRVHLFVCLCVCVCVYVYVFVLMSVPQSEASPRGWRTGAG